MEQLEIRELSFRYAGGERDVLENVSFSVRSGEFVVVCGESGCGKTTLLRLLKPEMKPAGELTGEIAYHGASVAPPRSGTSCKTPTRRS